jgi:hypothetical protein
VDTLKITKALNKDQNLVVLCKTKSSEGVMFDMCKDLSKKFNNVCIVTVNRPFSSLREKLNAENIDYSKFQFVDCISAKYMEQIPSKQCIYISSPRALTEMAITLTQMAKNLEVIIIDNINGLFLYNGEVLTLRFLNSLVIRLRKTNTKILYLLLGETSKDRLADLSLFADKVIEI